MGRSTPRNWPAVFGLLLGSAGVVGYFALVVIHDPELAWWIHKPILNLSLVAVGLGLSAIGIGLAYQRKRGGRRLAPVLGLLNGALCGFLLWHLFVASYRLPPAANAPAVGIAAPDFELRNEHGDLVRLSSFRGQNIVLIFYRGFW